MLKRQRPISPPPSIPSVPLIVDSLTFDNLPPRETKRRRVLPPTLDGRSRGWGGPSHDNGGDDEEYVSEEEEQEDEGDDRLALGMEGIGEYKEANNVLHELHALQQHRLMFSSPSSPHLHHASPHTSSENFLTFGRENNPTKIDRQISQTRDPPYASPTAMQTETSHSKDEISLVTERYEDTNRLLRSLFLSRRRQLGALNEHSSTS
ncbi:hypothetical protein Hypma_015275 [Hypsizygus marmoreus]|uniref:Uncharacterized protein n=1 Tax=Hypsizygus marmoreus TaxID=39966 RepID=A0A369K752_HYPMA|nr:hypothetical protein Hypma_015275 [Hypsizygus marmoreus]